MRLLGTKLAANSSHRGFGDQLYDLSGQRPSLDLNFASNKSLVDSTTGQNLVSFTRASSGTYVDSQGVIRTATTNLLLRSEEFDNASWTKSGATITSNATTAPNGAITADALVEDTSTGAHNILQPASLVASSIYTFSVYVKAIDTTRDLRLFVPTGIFGSGNATFNLQAVTASPAGAVTSASITPLANGWYRCTAISSQAGSTGNGNFTMQLLSAGNATYTGNGASGIYLWGAQLEQSSTVGEYIPTTSTINSAPRFDHAITSSTTNLLLRSEEFDNGSWGPIAGTVSANQTPAPNGTTTADKLIATNGGPQGQVFQGVAIASGATCTGSVYVKGGGFDRFELVLLSNNNTTPYGRSVIDPNTGAIITGAFTQNGGTNASSNVQVLGNGWYRFSVTVTYPATGAAGMRLAVFNSDSSNGDGVKGVFLWGAQLEQSSTVGAYVPTTTAAATSSTTESLGLLVEESRTNLSLNTVWAGGVTPTSWTAQFAGAPSVTTSNLGNADGGVALSFTCSASRDYLIQTVALAANTTYTFSVYVESTDQYPSASANIIAIANGPSGSTITGAVGNPANKQRIFCSIAVGATAGNAQLRVGLGVGSNATGTIVLSRPQLEVGAFPTSYIPTTAATATRSADVASISGSNFGVSRTNLLLRSEEFGDASWTKTAASVSANSIAAPNGTVTADSLIEDGTNASHIAFQAVSAVSGLAYTASIYAKKGTRSWAQIAFQSTAFGLNAWANFDLNLGAVGFVGTSATATIESIGDGWYRCSVTATASATSATGGCAISILNQNTNSRLPSHQGDGTSGIYLWGAQQETGTTATAYIPTPGVFVSRASSGTYIGGDGVLRSATTNLLLQSEDFSTIWGNVATTEIINATVAPNGTVSADEIIEDTATASHYINQSFTSVSGSIYTFSCYVKAANRAVCFLVANGPGTLHAVSVNLTTGVASSAVGSPSNIISTAVGNGWYRVSFTYTSGTTGAVGHEVRLSTDGLWANRIYTGNGTGSVYAWGAQLEQSSSVGEYIPTTSTVNSAARYDHDPVTLIGKGLLLEEARTNSIRNNTMIGAVAGTPGTLPTNWIYNTAGGLSTEVVGSGTESGIAYVDLRLFGTSTSTSAIQYDANTQIAAAQGQTWTLSHYVKLMAGSVPSGTNIRTRIIERSGGTGTYLGEFNAIITPASSVTPLAQARFAYSATLANVSTGYVVPGILFNWPASTVVDITLRIGLPQLEQGAYATSVIPTFNTTATRAADVSTSSAVTVFSSPWYRQDEGTVFASSSSYGATNSNRRIAFATDGTSSNRFGFLYNSVNTPQLVVASAGTLVASQSAVLTGANYSIAAAYKLDDYAITVAGSNPSTDTAGALPVGINQLGIGSQISVDQLNGTIRRLTYWPQRLSNSTLQSITQ